MYAHFFLKGEINVCTKCHGNPISSCKDISLQNLRVVLDAEDHQGHQDSSFGTVNVHEDFPGGPSKGFLDGNKTQRWSDKQTNTLNDSQSHVTKIARKFSVHQQGMPT